MISIDYKLVLQLNQAKIQTKLKYNPFLCVFRIFNVAIIASCEIHRWKFRESFMKVSPQNWKHWNLPTLVVIKVGHAQKYLAKNSRLNHHLDKLSKLFLGNSSGEIVSLLWTD